ncbi:MAG: FAD-dependent oxidoreductase, partial [Verrucomicrobiales bacterium]
MNVLIPSPKPVAVVGGGIAGLSAARRLREHGVPVVLFEGSDRVAGLARSFQDESGFTFDFGAHFITNRLAKCVGIEKECRDVK